MQIDDTQIFSRQMVLRAALPAMCSIWLVWLFSAELASIDVAHLRANVVDIDIGTWVLAVLFTWISFVAISGYDPIIAKILNADIPKRRAASISWKATAVSQLVGFGLMTGTLIRWLELGLNPDKSNGSTLPLAFKMTLTVSVSFLMSWAILTGPFAAWVFLNGPDIALLCLCTAIGGFVVLKTKPNSLRRLARHRVDGIKFLALTLVDTGFAALVIFVFLPPGLVDFSTLYLAFLVSYGAGLVSGLPGGVGPFEVCMIAFLSWIDPSVLAAALLAFRVVYFAVPAILAMAMLGVMLLHRRADGQQGSVVSHLPPALRRAAPPEFDLIHNDRLKFFVTANRSEASLIYSTGTSLVQLGDPFGERQSRQSPVTHLAREARWSKRALGLYRCNRATALHAVSLGMKAILFSCEAIIHPAEFDLRKPSRSGLRRKLRKAAKSGITINSRQNDPEALSRIDAAWVSENGRARGFSTGTFCHDLIKRQRLYTAYQDDCPVAFISVSAARSVWQLDLLRYTQNCPDGTIFALIAHAIEDARLCGVAQVSLGSVPFSPPIHEKSAFGKLSMWLFKRSRSLRGLYQFKQCFDPEWHDRYFIAESFLSGLRASFVIFKAINAPPVAKREGS